MANLRNLKKEIDYRLEEVVFDCDMAICFQPSKEKEVFEVMQEAVAVRRPTIPPSRTTVRSSASISPLCASRWWRLMTSSSRS